MAQRTVLSVSQHPATQLTRNLILERAGYQVISTGNSLDAARLLERSDVHALVLEDSISAGERQKLVRTFRQMKPRVPIIMFCRMNDSRELRESADEIVETHESPQRLLEALAHVLDGDGTSSRT